MMARVVILVQQETMKERPRIHKLAKVLLGMGVPFEIWKYGDPEREEFDGIIIRNLMSARWLNAHPALRYLSWMMHAYLAAFVSRHTTHFFAVGFDSAFPVACLPRLHPALVFDNIDNVSMSYRWPGPIRSLFVWLERWVAHRAQLHVNPSRLRWDLTDQNLRVVTNTPSAETLEESKGIARQHGYSREDILTIYLNGWLSATRGIGTLVAALNLLAERGRAIKVLVAGRPACSDANVLLALPNVENLGMLTNADALATYYRADLAVIYYDTSLDINRLAESQKWTDCWATETPFVSNVGIQTLQPYVDSGACFALPYGDAAALAMLLEGIIDDRSKLQTVRRGLASMKFRYWDDEMKIVMREWLQIGSH